MAKKGGLSQPERYQLYLEERKLLIDAERESARSFDKAILTLAAGAFGFSVAFLRDIVRNPFPNTRWLLGMSWALFSISIILILTGFLTSQHGLNRQIDLSFDDIMNDISKSNEWNLLTEICNVASILVLAAALTFSGLFVYWNLVH
jgi:hypothetical protein